MKIYKFILFYLIWIIVFYNIFYYLGELINRNDIEFVFHAGLVGFLGIIVIPLFWLEFSKNTKKEELTK